MEIYSLAFGKLGATTANSVQPIKPVQPIKFNSGTIDEIGRRLESFKNANCLTVAHNYFEDIAEVEFFPPATKVTFKCGAVMTATAHEGDEFNKEVGIMICILKYMCLCSLGKNVNTYLHREIKKVEGREKEQKRKLQKDKEREEIKARQKAKRERYKAKRAAAKRQQEIEIQKEAYLQAMQEMNAGK